jgi:ATP dependent DNA ligase C terminal region
MVDSSRKTPQSKPTGAVDRMGKRTRIRQDPPDRPAKPFRGLNGRGTLATTDPTLAAAYVGIDGNMGNRPRWPGAPRKTTRWFKIKVRHEGRFIVGGIAATASGYRGLLLAQRVGRELRYVGTVEWGVGRALVDALMASGSTCAGSPLTDHRHHRDVVWLEPRVVAEVTYSEFVGGWLRDPVLQQIVLS